MFMEASKGSSSACLVCIVPLRRNVFTCLPKRQTTICNKVLLICKTFEKNVKYQFVKAERRLFKVINSAKNKRLPLKSFNRDFSGSTPKTLIDISRRQWFTISYGCSMYYYLGNNDKLIPSQQVFTHSQQKYSPVL